MVAAVAHSNNFFIRRRIRNSGRCPGEEHAEELEYFLCAVRKRPTDFERLIEIFRIPLQSEPGSDLPEVSSETSEAPMVRSSPSFTFMKAMKALDRETIHL